MKITYVTNVRMPTHKAHGIQMIKMCEAFANVGADVTFFVPMRHNSIKEDPFEYYGVERNFTIRYLPSIDIIRFIPKFGFLLQEFTFVLFVLGRFLFASRKTQIFYTREYYLASLAQFLGFAVVYEGHQVPGRSQLFFRLLRRVKTIITNSEGVAREFREHDFARVLAFPNGIDLKAFDFIVSKNKLRGDLGLPKNKSIALYTGHLYDWKGIDVVVKAAKELASRKESVHIVCVGGTEEDLLLYQERIEKEQLQNIEFLGHKNHKNIPKYLRAADVLLLPNVPISKESIQYTSPVKLPEYMASETPIIASDLPSIRALVSESEVVFVKPGDASALADAIFRVVHNKDDAIVRAKKALEHVKEWTWEKRASSILAFIQK